MSTTTNRKLPNPVDEPTVNVLRAAAILGVSTRATYAAIERGEIPTIRVGRVIKIPTAKFLRHFGLIEAA